MSKKLTEKQYAAIELLTQVPQTLQLKQIAEKVGVGESTLRRWRNDETFNNEVIRQVKRNAVADLPRVMAAAPEIIVGDKNAAFFRTWLQAIGVLTEKVEVETSNKEGVDIEAIKARLLANKTE